LRWRVADAIDRYGRQGLDVEASAPLIDRDFPEASDEDKAIGLELAAGRALMRISPAPNRV
jgi:hypothetical protein